MKPVVAFHTKFADAIQQTLNEAKARKLNVALYSGIRSAEEQDNLYALGRTVKNPDGVSFEKPMGNIVTNGQAWSGWHCYGLAADLVFKDAKNNWTWNKKPEEWEQLGIIGEIFGLQWGGRWKMKDYPHFQLTGTLKNVQEAKKILFRDGIEAVWNLV